MLVMWPHMCQRASEVGGIEKRETSTVHLKLEHVKKTCKTFYSQYVGNL